jgi:hypothetical protein
MIAKGVIADEQEYWDFIDSIRIANKLAEEEKNVEQKSYSAAFGYGTTVTTGQYNTAIGYRTMNGNNDKVVL